MQHKKTQWIMGALFVPLGIWWLRTDVWVGVGWIALGLAHLAYLGFTSRRGQRA